MEQDLMIAVLKSKNALPGFGTPGIPVMLHQRPGEDETLFLDRVEDIREQLKVASKTDYQVDYFENGQEV